MATQQTPQPGTGLAMVAHAPVAVAETAASAVAAQAKAAVEARYLVALQQPRNWLTVRQRLLDACKRPGFAGIAKYAKPVGGSNKVVGPSIRFAEEALRAMGNCLVESMVVFDDREKRIVRITVTDLEANLSYPQDIVLEKTVERRQPRSGQTVLRSRTNSSGQLVYLVEATEDDLLNKQNALSSKAVRTGALRVLPGDILEEAMEQVDETIQNEDARDPQSAVKKIADAFHAIGVSVDALEQYLAHPLAQCSPAEIQQLRQVFQAIKEGEATWQSTVEQHEAERAPRSSGEQKPAKPSAKGADGLRAALKKPPQETPAPTAIEESDDEIRAEELALLREEEGR